VVPYRVYDVGANIGYVSLGIDHDTAQFAVNAARLWLDRMGRERYPADPIHRPPFGVAGTWCNVPS
jgi:Rhodopirellula transposase DDE domain